MGMMRLNPRLFLMMLACLPELAMGAPEADTPPVTQTGPATPATSPSTSASRAVSPPVAGSPALNLQEFQVRGNTVLSKEAIEEAVYPHLGPGKSVADVEKARADLEKAYHDAGYLTVYVTVPEQKVEHGVVTLKVTEGVIERTRVSGAQYTLPSRIKSEAPSIAEGEVPNFNDMQHDLDTINRAPGLRVTPALEPGRMPGTTDIDLKVNDSIPVSAWMDYNNAHSANTATNQLAGGVTYKNLFQRAQTLSMQFQTLPQHPAESTAVSASYMVPLDGYQRYLSIYGVHSISNVTSSSVSLGDQALFGNNDILGARYIMPLRSRTGMTQQAILGMDYKDSKQDASGISTPVRYMTLDANYSLGLTDGSGNWQLGAGMVLGLRSGETDQLDFGQRRYQARDNFAVLKLDAQRQQKLPAGWALLASTNMQLSDQPLINNEQLTAGVVGSVRGYLQAEAAGDQGIRGSLELHAPTWNPGGWTLLKNIEPYVFLDGAYLHVTDALPGETASYTLASVGLGLNMNAGRGFSLNLNVGDPLKDGPKNNLSVSPAQSYTEAYKPRVNFDTRLDF